MSVIDSRFSSIRLFLFDMDGTLYLGNRLFSFTPSLLETLRAQGKRYLFITNNSSKSTEAYVKKLANMGVEARKEDFLTSAEATARYLQEHHPGKRLYVCGTTSFKAELQAAGFSVVEETDAAECVVMGFDTELTFRKLEDVSRLLCTRDIPYIATNPDWVCPTEFGSVPDCGSVCEMLRRATGKSPVVIGKPSPYMIELAMKKAACSAAETAVVGDRLYTDIQSGLNAGATGVLVMSGETTPEILAAETVQPDVILPHAGALVGLDWVD